MQGLKRSNEDQAQEKLQEIKKLKYADVPSFKKKSNEDQFKSTNAVMMCLDDATDFLSKKDLDKTKEAIDKGRVLLTERQKLIKLADKSPFGWKTVLEYKQHDLAADEEIPPPFKASNNKSAINERQFVEQAITELLLHECIIEVGSPPGIINPLSVSIQRGGKKRLIIDLRHVNLHIFKSKFRCEDISMAKEVLKPGDFMFSFDLKSGYHHVDIFKDHQNCFFVDLQRWFNKIFSVYRSDYRPPHTFLRNY